MTYREHDPAALTEAQVNDAFNVAWLSLDKAAGFAAIAHGMSGVLGVTCEVRALNPHVYGLRLVVRFIGGATRHFARPSALAPFEALP